MTLIITWEGTLAKFDKKTIFDLLCIIPIARARRREENKMGWKNNEFEVENLVKFFLIAFGWTWLYWSLFIFQVINLPPGIGTPNARAQYLGFLEPSLYQRFS